MDKSTCCWYHCTGKCMIHRNIEVWQWASVFSCIVSRSYCCMKYGRLLSCCCCPSVCKVVYCGAQGRCRGWKLCRRDPRRGLPIHFFRYVCCSRIVSFSHKRRKSQRTPKLQISVRNCKAQLFQTTICSCLMRWSRSTKLLYTEPGYYLDGWLSDER